MRYWKLVITPLCVLTFGGCNHVDDAPLVMDWDRAAPAFPETDRTLFASSIGLPANGISLGDGRAVAMMLDMACGVEPDTGRVFFDLAMPHGRVEDGSAAGDTLLTSLVIQPPLLHLVPVQNPFARESYLVQNIEQARTLPGAGFVALTRGDGLCAVRRYHEGVLVDSLRLSEHGWSCTGELDLAADPISGSLAVASESGVLRIDADGTHLVHEGPSRVAFGPTGALVVSSGSALVQLDGDHVSWELSLDGSITHLVASGSEIATLSTDGFTSTLSRISPTGEVVDSLALGFDAAELAISPEGDLIGLSTAFAQAYYLLR